MVKNLIRIVVVLVILCGAVYFLGVRIFVIPSSDGVPEGATILAMAATDLKMVDSPAAYCGRQKSPSAACRGVIAMTVTQGTILLRLPYSDWLYGLTGAPTTTN